MTTSNTVNINEIPVDPTDHTKTAWGPTLASQYYFVIANGTAAGETFDAADISAGTKTLMATYGRGISVNMGGGGDTVIGSAYGDVFSLGTGTNYLDGGDNLGTMPGGARARDVLNVFAANQAAVGALKVVQIDPAATGTDGAAYAAGYRIKVSNGSETDYLKNVEQVNVFVSNGSGYTYAKTVQLAIDVTEVDGSSNVSANMHMAWVQGSAFSDSFDAATDISSATRALMDQNQRGVWVNLGAGDNTVVGSAYGDDITVGAGTNYIDGGGNAGSPPWGGKAQDVLHVTVADQAAANAVQVIQLTAGMTGKDAQAFNSGYTQKIVAGAETDYVKGIERVAVQIQVGDQFGVVRDIPLTVVVQEANLATVNSKSPLAWVYGTDGADAIDLSGNTPLLSTELKAAMAARGRGVWVNGSAGNDTVTGTAYGDVFVNGPGNAKIDGGAGIDTFEIAVATWADVSTVQVSVSDDPAWQFMVTYSGSTQKDYLKNVEVINLTVAGGPGKQILLAPIVTDLAGSSTNLAQLMHFVSIQGTAQGDHIDVATDVSSGTRALMDQYQRGVVVGLGPGNNTVVGSAYGDDFFTVPSGTGTNYIDGGGNAGSPPGGGMAQDMLHVTVADKPAMAALQVVQLTAGMTGADAQAFSNGYTHKVVAGAETDYIKGIERVSVSLSNYNGELPFVRDIPLTVVVQEANLVDPASANYYHLAWVTGAGGNDTIDLSAGTTLLSSQVQAAMAARGRGVWVDGGAGNDIIVGTAYADNFRNGPGNSKIDGGDNLGPNGQKGMDVFEIAVANTTELNAVQVLPSDDPAWQWMVTYGSGSTQKDYLKNIEAVSINVTGTNTGKWISLALTVNEIAATGDLANSMHYAWVQGTAQAESFNAATDISAATRALMDQNKRGVWIDMGAGNSTVVGSGYGDDITVGAGTNYVDGGANAGSPPWGGKAQDVLHVNVANQAAADAVQVTALAAGMTGADAQAFTNGYTHKVVAGAEIDYIKGIERVSIQIAGANGSSTWVRDVSLAVLVQEVNVSDPNAVKGSTLAWVTGTAGNDTIDLSGDTPLLTSGLKAAMAANKHGVYVDGGAGNDVIVGTAYADYFKNGPGNSKIDGGANIAPDGQTGVDVFDITVANAAELAAVKIVASDDPNYQWMVTYGSGSTQKDYLKNIEAISLHETATGTGKWIDLGLPPPPANTAPTFTGVPPGVAVSDFGADYGALGGTALASGKLLTASYGQAVAGGDYMLYLTRANADGSVDTSFGGGTGRVLLQTSYSTVAAPLELSGGKLLVGVATYGTAAHFRVLRLNADGSTDATFGTGGSTTVQMGTGADSLRKILVDASGKILMVGNTESATGRDLAVARLNADGSLDTTFNGSGKFTLSLGSGTAVANAVAVQADGKVVLAGYAPNGSDNQFAVVRLNADGTLDTSFGNGGKVLMPVGPGANLATAIEVLAGGKILLGGYAKTGAASTTDWDPALVRLNADGSIDNSFGSSGVVKTHLSDFNDNLTAMKVQADGKIVILSDSGFNANSMNGQVAVVRYNTDGTLDTSFGNGGIVKMAIHGVSEQPNSLVLVGDKIVVFASSVNDGSFNTSNVILRLNADGSPDTTFGASNPSSLGGTIKVNGTVPVALDANAAIFDAELAKAGNYAGAKLTLARHGGANAQDVFRAMNEVSVDDSGNVSVASVVVGTVTQVAGTLTITFNANATQGLVNRALHGIGYTNSSSTPPSSVVIDWTFSDGNSGAQGTGGALAATGSTTVQIGTVVYETLPSALNAANAPDGRPLANINYLGVVNGTAGADTFDSATGFSAAQRAVMDQYKHGAYFDMGAGDNNVTGTGYSDLFVLGQGTSRIDGGAQDGTLNGGAGKDIVNVYVTSQAQADAVTVDRLSASASGADKTAYDAGYTFKVKNGGEIAYLKNVEQVSILQYTDSNGNGVRDTSEAATFLRAVDLTAPPPKVNSAPTFTGVPAGVAVSDFGADYGALGGTALASGKLLTASYGQAVAGGDYMLYLTRANADGSVDTSFGGGSGRVLVQTSYSTVAAPLELSGGKLLVGVATYGSAAHFRVLRLNADGSTDATFGTGGSTTVQMGTGADSLRKILVDGSGKILMVGNTESATGRDLAVARLNADGSLDTSFNGSGKFTLSLGSGTAVANAVAVQADGKVVLAGYAPNGSDNQFAVVRLNADGTLDTSFGNGGKVLMPVGPGANLATAIEVLAGGKILLGGYAKTGAASTTDWDPALVRLNADGSVDNSFGSSGVVKTHLSDANDNLTAMKVQADGKIVVLSNSGYSATGTNGQIAVVRYNADGTLDTGFGTGGVVKTMVHGVAEQPNSLVLVGDKIVVFASSANDGNFNTSNVILRLNADGSPDATFGANNPSSLGGSIGADGIHPVALDANAAVFDAELAAAGSFAGATLTLVRHGGANAQDVFRSVNEVSVDDNGNVTVASVVIGTVSQSAGTLTLTFNANATQGLVNRALHGIGYTNTSSTPPSSVVIDWTFSDGNSGAQGTGGALTTSGSTTVQIGTQVYETLPAALNAANAPDGRVLANINYLGNVYGTRGADTFDSATGFSAAQRAVMDQYKHGAYFDMGAGDNTVTGTGYSDLFVFGAGTSRIDGGAQDGTLNGGAGKDIINVFVTSQAQADAVTVDRLTAAATGADKAAFDAGYTFKVTNGTEIGYLKNIEQVSILQWTDANDNGLRDSGETTFLRAVDLTTPPPKANTAPTFTGVPPGVAVSDFGTDFGALAGTALASGKLVTLSYGALPGADYMLYLTRANADGSVDTSFGGGTGRVLLQTSYSTVAAPLELSGGKLLGGVATYGTAAHFRVLRLNADGSTDATFGTGGSTTVQMGTGADSLRKVLVDASGKILMVGNTESATGRDLAVARLNADGSLDTTFNGSGKFTLSLGSGTGVANAVAVQADGKVVLAGFAPNGSDNQFAVVRLNADGTLDTSFGSGGKVLMPIGPGANLATAIEVLASGKILIGGYAKTGAASTTDWDPALVRLNADGSIDNSFGSSGVVKTHLSDFNDNLTGMKVQADGKIVVLSDSGYNASSMNGQVAVLRYNADGTLDTSFGAGGIVKMAIHGVSEQPNSLVLVGDKIVVFGSSVNDSKFNTSNVILRLNADGTPDTTFGVGNPSSLGGTIKADGIHPVTLDANAAIFDADLAKAGNYAGATLTLARHGGANADDVFFATNDVSGDDNGNLMVGTIIVATVSESAGTVTLTFNANATQGLVNRALHGIGYTNTSSTPPSSVVIDWTFSDGNGGGQGTGGALTATGSTTVQIGMQVYETLSSVLNSANAPDGRVLANINYLGNVYGTRGADTFDSATGFSAAQRALMDQYKHGAYFDMGDGDNTVTGTGYSDLFVFGAGTSRIDGGAQDGALNGGAGKDIVNVFVASPAQADAVTVDRLTASATGADKTAFDAGYAFKLTNGVEIGYLKNIEQVSVLQWNDTNDNGLRDSGETTFLRAVDLTAPPKVNAVPTFAGAPAGMALVRSGYDFTPTGLATLADGRMMTLSLMDMVADGDNYTMALARHNADGSLDTSYGAGGKVLLPVVFGSVIAPPVVLADGKVLLAVSSPADFKVVRLNADGSVDNTFGSNGSAVVSLNAGTDLPTKLMVQADGKIVVAGTAAMYSATSDMAAVRLTADGQLDTSFNGNGTLVVPVSAGIDRASAAVLQADGKLLMAGTAAGASSLDFALVRVNADGTLDTGFGSGGKALLAVSGGDDRAYAVAVQADGKIVLAGDSFNGADGELALARFNADGSVDTTFGSGGKVVLHQSSLVERGQFVLVQGDGKIVTAGWSGGGGNGGALTVTRLNADGSLDNGFGDHGVVALALQGMDNRAAGLALVNGKLVVLGISSFNVDADASMMLVRLNMDGTLDTSFGTPNSSSLTGVVQADGLHPALLAFNGALYDAELAAQGNYSNATLSIARQGGASADDVFSASGEVSFANHTLSVAGTAIGTVDQAGGQLVVHFSEAATQGLVNRALHGLAYANAAAAPAASVTLNWSLSDGQGAMASTATTVQIGVTIAEQVRAFIDPTVNTSGTKLSTLPYLASVSGSLRGESFDAQSALSAQVKGLMAELQRGADIQTHGGGDTVTGTAYGDHFVMGAGVNYIDGGANNGTDPSGAAAVDVLEVFVANQAAADAVKLVALSAQSTGADLAAFNAGYLFKVDAGSEIDYLKNVEKVQVTIWNDLNGNHLQDPGELTQVKLIGVSVP